MATKCAEPECKKIGKKRGPKPDNIYVSSHTEPVMGRNPEELKRVLCEIIDRYHPLRLNVTQDGTIEFSFQESYKNLIKGKGKREVNPSERSELE